MKTVRFLVEGKKDVCFIRAFFAARFPGFTEIGVPEGSADGVSLRTEEVCVEVIPVGGYTKLNRAKSSAEDKNGDGLYVALIFDADETGVEKGGVADRTKFLKETISTWRLLAPPKKAIDIFLFPDNDRDGELENLLEDIVPQKYVPIIAECWRRYEACLEVHGGQKPSQKSKMNDYEAAVLGPSVWDHGGIMKGLLDPTLWDWNSPKVAPLFDFIRRQLSVVEEGT